MSLVTGTARTGEAAAVAEAPLLDVEPVIIGTLAICTVYVCVRIYEQVLLVRGTRFLRARVHHLLDDHPLYRGNRSN